MPNKYGVDTEEFDEEVYEAGIEIIKQQEEAQLVTSQDIDFVIYVMVKEAPYR